MQMLKKLSEDQKIKLNIPADISLIGLVRLVLAGYLRKNLVIDEESTDDLKLALGEFLAKVIEANLVGKYIPIEMGFNGGSVELTISKLEEFKPDQLFDSPYLNFEAVSKLVDNFDLLLAEDQRVAVRIVKKLVVNDDDK